MYRMVSVLTIVLTVWFTACLEQEPTSPLSTTGEEVAILEKAGNGRGQVTVMTRNVYVGTDVDVILGAEDPQQIPFLVAQAFEVLLATDFPERAKALAKEIQQNQPHLVGLQEISLIRTQSPGDFFLPTSSPAEDVLFDFLEILLSEVNARGGQYRVAGIIQNADVELPMFVLGSPPRFDDVRLTDFDVVLARKDVAIDNVLAQNYQIPLPVDDLGIVIPRGFVAVDATVKNKTYRFVNTHLEAFALPVRFAQASELLQVVMNETHPVIMVGDFNTRAEEDLSQSGTTYQLIRGQGFEDVWLHNLFGNQGSGYTSPHAADLRNEVVALDRRIDLIFVRGTGLATGPHAIGPVYAEVVGDELRDRTPSGLWPSDHAGVVAKLHLPSPVSQVENFAAGHFSQ